MGRHGARDSINFTSLIDMDTPKPIPHMGVTLEQEVSKTLHSILHAAQPRLSIMRVSDAVPLPKYQGPGDSGIDLHAYIEAVDSSVKGVAEVVFGKTTKIRTGIKVAIPDGYEGQVRGRSGRAFYDGVFAFNGTIDSSFRGEIMVLLTGTRENEIFRVINGDRIAQLVISPVARCAIVEVERLDATVRGENGLGSSGS